MLRKFTRKISNSFTMQLALWVASIVVALSCILIWLLASFSEEVIRRETIDATLQALENTALRVDNTLRQEEMTARLEHKRFRGNRSRIEKLVEDGNCMTIGKLLKTPVFILGIILMMCAGASEMSMAQWASAFVESALGFSKTVGDLVGPCMFAVTMGTSRVIYGKYGERIDLTVYMLGSGALCFICYLLAAISHNPLLSLAGCIFCGFSVGIMWPGSISILSRRLPAGGTAMFALLAMAGDLGGAAGPAFVGFVTDLQNENLKAGMLAGAVFPVVMIVSILMIKTKTEKNSSN